MKKIELLNLLDIDIDINCEDEQLVRSVERKLQIDNVRKLHYSVDNNPWVSVNKITGKKDYLTLIFPTFEYGEVGCDYSIESREPSGILKEIKKYTEEYYKECADFLNGNKVLPNNWD